MGSPYIVDTIKVSLMTKKVSIILHFKDSFVHGLTIQQHTYYNGVKNSPIITKGEGQSEGAVP